MAPPTKRRRPNVTLSSTPESSDLDDEPSSATSTPQSKVLSHAVQKPATRSLRSSSKLTQTQLTPTKTRTRLESSASPSVPLRAGRPGTKSASTSPEKSRGKTKIKDIGKHADLFTLFSNQAQRQQKSETLNGTSKTTKSVDCSNDSIDDYDEIIDSDGDEVTEKKEQKASIIGANARKRGRELLTRDAPNTKTSSQRFLIKPPSRTESISEIDKRPWAERFGPVNLEELAVHKKKVADVRGWLEASLEGRIRQKLLVLKGAAGTGKTTTVQLLSQVLNCDVLEWRNPIGSVGSSEGFISMSAQFEDFIGRGRNFSQLDIFSEAEPPAKDRVSTTLDRRKSIILIEEFPNTFTRSSSTLQSFRTALLHYIESSTSFPSRKDVMAPIVLIVSETLLTTMSASADSFTAHRLLGPKILQHPGVTTIEFNPIAPTFITKALELVVQKESRKSGRRRTPGPLVLKRLGEVGDIRSAIGSLEFLCLRGDTDGDWGGRVLFSKPKKGAKGDVALTKMERESLELVTRREASLGIFHAVGKVVYNKRDELAPHVSDEPDPEDLPDYLRPQSRPQRSQVALDELIDETGTDTQTFVAALHENYALSCEAPYNSQDYTSLDHLNGCIDALSDADLLTPNWDGSFNSTGFGGGTGGRGSGGDILRQDEMCFQIATRGLLFSLPNPVKRQAAANGSSRNNDAYKMFYPTSMKLWRLQEVIEGALDAWSSPMARSGDLSGASQRSLSHSSAPGNSQSVVESWNRNRGFSSIANDTPTAPQTTSGDLRTPVSALGASAREELILERLPYQYQILKSQRQRGLSAISMSMRNLEKVVVLKGIDTGADPEEDMAENDGDERASRLMAGEWATDKPVEFDSPRKKKAPPRGRRKRDEDKGNGLDVKYMDREAKELEVKLVLSDDDIEDD